MPEGFHSISVSIFFKTNGRLVTDPDQTSLGISIQSAEKVSSILEAVATELQSTYFIATGAYYFSLHASTHKDPTHAASSVQALSHNHVLQNDAQYPYLFVVLECK